MSSSESTLCLPDQQQPARRRRWRPLPPEWRHSIEIGAPIMLTVWVNMGMSVTDTWMVSRLGSSAVAAVAVGSDLKSIVLYFFGGILAGLMPALAAAVAQSDQQRINQVWSALRAVGCMAAVIAVPFVWFAPDYLALLGIDSTLLEQSAGYTRYAALSLIPMLVISMQRILLTACEKPRVFFNATLSALPLNAMFNAVLIQGVGPLDAMGVDGAGLATLMTSCILAMLVFWRLKQQDFGKRLSARFSLVSLRDIVDCLEIGTPIGITVLAEIGVYLGATLYLAVQSSEAVAAHTLALRLAGIAYAVPMALSQVATLRMAQSNHPAQRRQVIVSQLQMATISALLLFIALALAANPVAQILRDGTELGEQAAGIAWSLIWILAFTELIEPFSTTATGLLRGRNDTFVPMLISTGAYWLFSVPLALWLAPGAESTAGAVWICLLSGMLLSAVLLIWRLDTCQQTDESRKDG